MTGKLRRLEFLFRHGKLGLKPVGIFVPPRRTTESKNRHDDVFSVGVVFDGLRKHERVHLRRHNFRHSDTYVNSGLLEPECHISSLNWQVSCSGKNFFMSLKN